MSRAVRASSAIVTDSNQGIYINPQTGIVAQNGWNQWPPT